MQGNHVLSAEHDVMLDCHICLMPIFSFPLQSLDLFLEL